MCLTRTTSSYTGFSGLPILLTDGMWNAWPLRCPLALQCLPCDTVSRWFPWSHKCLAPLTSSSLAVSPVWYSLPMVPIISHNVNSNWRKKPSPQDYIGQPVHTSCYHNYIVICFPELQEGLLYIGLCLYHRLSMYKVSRMVKFHHYPVVQKTSCPSLYFPQRP